MKFDDVVVGNGLLGAAAALELARSGRDVCVIGARYGHQAKLFSSHEDDSRIVRVHHDDNYWAELSQANSVPLDALVAQTGVQCYRRAPVFYRGNTCGGPWVIGRRSNTGPRLACQFDAEDVGGGILNPVLYIAAMNQAARGLGADIRAGIVDTIRESRTSVEVFTADEVVTSDRVVDARGVFGLDAGAEQPKVVGKVLWYFERLLDEAPEPFCFVDSLVDGQPFLNVYGIVDYAVVDGPPGKRWSLSKLGVSERTVVTLESTRELSEWFTGGYHRYPYRGELVAWAARFLGRPHRIRQIRPCALGTTADGRPILRRSNRILSIRGCNGCAAKCAQALMAKALIESGWIN